MNTRTIVFLLVLFVSGCNAQEIDKKDQKDRKKEQGFELNQPQERWEVNKETDEHGNITRYDSTYVWSYSNSFGDSLSLNVDSMMNSMNQFFGDRFPSIWDDGLLSPFGNDPLSNDPFFKKDFFNDDFFEKRWEHNMFDMDEMFHRMDSLRNQFFEESYPDLIQPQPKKEKTKTSQI
ncbi:MAG: hypothetical protein HKN39_08740 [Flavobacteriales bacterium]|nr:hypothetical protein [Flavobacteriales bacterium]